MFILSSFALSFALTTAAPAKDASGIDWVHDDWARAKTRATEAGQLVVIDVWATWCHTCLSMKNFVLTDPAMNEVAKQHTFLALDFDKPENGAFFAKIPVGGLPTFLVVDPKTETLVGRWVGSGTPQQMAQFFKEADAKSTDPLILGHRALAKEDFKGAVKHFETGLAKKDLSAHARTLLLVGWIEALMDSDPMACAKQGPAHLKETNDTAPGVDYASYVAMCAGMAEKLSEAEKKSVMAAVRDRLAPIVATAPALTVDDRSGVYSTLIEAYTTLGDQKNADKTAAARLAMLEDAAKKAATPGERATFDAHRLEEYLRAKRFAEAEKMLAATESAQPQDFNPPWRLAVLFSKQGKTNEGLAAIERALARGYGARKLRLYSVKVDLLMQKKSWEAARKTVADARTEITKLHPSQVRPSWVKELDGKLEAIAKAEKTPS